MICNRIFRRRIGLNVHCSFNQNPKPTLPTKKKKTGQSTHSICCAFYNSYAYEMKKCNEKDTNTNSI